MHNNPREIETKRLLPAWVSHLGWCMLGDSGACWDGSDVILGNHHGNHGTNCHFSICAQTGQLGSHFA